MKNQPKETKSQAVQITEPNEPFSVRELSEEEQNLVTGGGHSRPYYFKRNYH